MLKDNKLLIYTGGALATVAVAMPLVPSHAAFCIDNRVMCAPPSLDMGDKPSGDEPLPLFSINPLSVIASTGTLFHPQYLIRHG